MAYDSVPKNARDVVIIGNDATGTPITFTMIYEPGDLTAGPFVAGGAEVVPIFDRGRFMALRKTKTLFPGFSFTAWFTESVNATDGTPIDLVCKLGKFASGVSTLGGATADVWTFDLVMNVEGTDIGGTDSTLTLEDCHGQIEFAEGEEVSKWNISGTCYGTWTWT